MPIPRLTDEEREAALAAVLAEAGRVLAESEARLGEATTARAEAAARRSQFERAAAAETERLQRLVRQLATIQSSTVSVAPAPNTTANTVPSGCTTSRTHQDGRPTAYAPAPLSRPPHRPTARDEEVGHPPARPHLDPEVTGGLGEGALDLGTGGVAAGLTLPVEVLMKSAPASMASHEARRTLSRVRSSPVSRITLRWAGPQACLTATISSNTRP